MIVSCPSCGTLYKHRVDVEAARGRCSCCDELVSLSTRRRYALRTAGVPWHTAAPALARAVGLPQRKVDLEEVGLELAPERRQGSLRIGMDDPCLEQSVSRTALDGDGRQDALTYAVLGPDEGPSATGRPLGGEVASATGRTSAGSAQHRRARNQASREAGRRPGGGAGVMAILLGGAIGGLVGLGVSWALTATPTPWWFSGAGIGTVLGWGIRTLWTSRRA